MEVISLTEIQQDILNTLRRETLTRDEICELLGCERYLYKYNRYRYHHKKEIIKTLSRDSFYGRTTIYDNLYKLLKRGLVEKFCKSNGKRGRPTVYWKLTEAK